MDRILKTRISFITLRFIFKSFISTMFSLKKTWTRFAIIFLHLDDWDFVRTLKEIGRMIAFFFNNITCKLYFINDNSTI